jgi:hypothetical protein
MDAETQKILQGMVKDGSLKAWGCCVVGEGVFFTEEQPATIFAKRHNKTLIRIETERLTGWLAQNK